MQRFSGPAETGYDVEIEPLGAGKTRSRLTASHAHVPAYARTVMTVDDKVMTFRLEADGAINRFVQ